LNDGLNRPVKRLRIAEQPRNGEAWVNLDNTVSYRPLADYCNNDASNLPESFSYEVCFDDGTKMTASVFVDVACIAETPKQEVMLYPNPATRFAYLDVSALDGESIRILVYNDLGRMVKQLGEMEAGRVPVLVDLDGLASGHYTVWVRPAGGKPLVRKLVVGEMRR
jgi:hypothetical protein